MIVFDDVDNVVYVTEFGTYGAPSEHGASGYYKDKILKYSSPLLKRLNKFRLSSNVKLVLNVLIVTPTLVLSSCRLNQILVDELVLRFRVARAIINELHYSYNWSVEAATDSTELSIKGQLETIDAPDVQDRFFITSDLINHCKVDPNSCDEELIWKHIAKKAESLALDRRKQTINVVKMIEDSRPCTDEYQVENRWLNYPYIDIMKSGSFVPRTFGNNTPMSRLWNAALSNMNSDPGYNYEELINMAENNISRSEIMKEDRRDKQNRVIIKMNDDDALYHAHYGINAREFRNHKSVLEKREKKQKPIKSDNPFWIYEWICDNFEKLLNYSPNPCPEEPLISKADELSGNQFDCFRELEKELRCTSLVNWLYFLSAIGTELGISIKQYVRSKNEFVLKRVPNWPAFILIKPTQKDSHLFFTILIHTPIENGVLNPFRELIDLEGMTCFKWCSIQEDKLQNLITCPYVFMASWMTFKRHIELPNPEKINDVKGDLQTFSHALLCTLVALEDKARTEELITLSRYVYMEAFVEEPSFPKPEKVLSKIDFRPRSLLELYFQERLINLIIHISQNNLIPLDDQGEEMDVEGEVSTDNFEGLISLFTGEKIRHFEMALDIAYAGYWKNKHTKGEGNQSLNLLKKIMVCEDALDDVDPDNLGFNSNLNLKQHEFSSNAVKFCADALLNHLKAQHGSQIKEVIKTDFIKRLANTTYESMATLKATCVADPVKLFPSKDPEVNKKEGSRSKVIIEIFKLLEQGTDKTKTPYTDLTLFLEAAENQGGLVVDLFKKSQHAGLREIYVLNLVSRIIQYAVETLARVICELTPSEAMTHPSSKPYMPSEHIKQCTTYKIKGDRKDVFTRKMNDDARKWSQTHHVTKFFLFISRLVPTSLHNFLARALNLWVKRKIKIPVDVINIFMNNESITFSDKVHQRIFNVFKGIEKAPWLNPGEQWLQIRGGMMQGILHYTSSAFHCGLQLYLEGLSRKYIKVKHPELSLVWSHQTSSDDSGTIATLIGKITEQTKFELECLLFCKWALSELVAIYPSTEKSTPLTLNVYEFNSDFYVRKGRLKPTIRWTTATMLISETESLIERQESFTNLRRQLLEGGAPIGLCRFINILQARLHYLIMGSNANNLFAHFCQLALQYPDPHYGFYIMDPSFLAGMVPFSYGHWLVCTNTRIGADYQWEMSNEPVTILRPSGRAVRHTFLRWGGYRKYKSIISKLDCNFDWQNHIESNPQIFLLGPITKEDNMAIIMDRLHAPGVAASLGVDNVLPRMIASSVYILHEPSLTTVSVSSSIIDPDEDNKRKRVCIISILKSKCSEEEREKPSTLKELFPDAESYEYINSIQEECCNSQKVRWSSQRRIRTYLTIIDNPRQLTYSLLEIVKFLWYDIQLRTPKDHIAVEVLEYQTIYKWLRRDPESTLQASPYEKMRDLINFICKTHKNTRRLIVNASSMRTSESNALTFSKRSQWPGILLTNPARRLAISKRTLEKSRRCKVTHGITMMMKFGGFNVKYLNGELRTHIKSIHEDLIGCVRGNVKEETLGIIINFIRQPDTPHNQVIDKIRHLKLGVIGGFTLRQKTNVVNDQVKYVGQGVWEGYFGDVPIRLFINDDDLWRIEIRSEDQLRRIIGPLRQMCHELSWTPKSDRHFHGLVLTNKFQIRHGPVSEGGSITLNKNMKEPLMMTKGLISFDCNSNTLRLSLNQRNSKVTILSWTPSVHDVLPYKSDELSNRWFTSSHEIFSKWIMRESLTVDESLELAATIDDHRSTHLMRTWFHAACASTLRNKGWAVKSLTESISNLQEEPTPDFEMTDFIDFGEIVQFEEEALDLPSLVDQPDCLEIMQPTTSLIEEESLKELMEEVYSDTLSSKIDDDMLKYLLEEEDAPAFEHSKLSWELTVHHWSFLNPYIDYLNIETHGTYSRALKTMVAMDEVVKSYVKITTGRDCEIARTTPKAKSSIKRWL
uniref:RNA-dependent RNA polymerase n=1 Tax=Beihai bunya-like virus 1 TaxID=1922371 RepID=A0A1L3KPC3_9VIRU|nr:RNA-dependent RNA polymerase [Beihai bunya-like virus 1]